MSRSWSSWRTSAADSVTLLKELLEDSEVSDRRLVSGYLEAKRMLADAFEAFALERYSNPDPIHRAKAMIEHAMRSTYAALPEKYLRVRGYGKVHEVILAYMDARVGSEVRVDELRMLTGDAVHTERRARDLRAMGFDLDAFDSGGTPVYVLRSPDPDVAAGAAQLIAKNIRDDKSLTSAERHELLRRGSLS